MNTKVTTVTCPACHKPMAYWLHDSFVDYCSHCNHCGAAITLHSRPDRPIVAELRHHHSLGTQE